MPSNKHLNWTIHLVYLQIYYNSPWPEYCLEMGWINQTRSLTTEDSGRKNRVLVYNWRVPPLFAYSESLKNTCSTFLALQVCSLHFILIIVWSLYSPNICLWLSAFSDGWFKVNAPSLPFLESQRIARPKRLVCNAHGSY